MDGEAKASNEKEKLSELTDLFYGEVTGRDDAKLEKVINSHGIFVVGLLSLNSPDIFGVGDDNMEMTFENTEECPESGHSSH